MNKDSQKRKIQRFLKGKINKDIDGFCIYQWIERCYFHSWWELGHKLGSYIPPGSFNQDFHKRLEYLLTECRSKLREQATQIEKNVAHSLSASQEDYLRFYRDLVRLLDGKLHVSLPDPQPKSYYQIKTGLNSVHFEWGFHGRPRSSFGVELHFEKGRENLNQTLMKQFYLLKQEIEIQTNESVIFQEEWGETWSRMYIMKNEGSMTEELKQWAVDKMEIFYRLLQPEIDKLKITHKLQTGDSTSYNGFYGSQRFNDLIEIIRNKGPLSSEEVHREFTKNPKYRAKLKTTRRRLTLMVHKGYIKEVGENLYDR